MKYTKRFISSGGVNITYEHPNRCPHCGTYIDAHGGLPRDATRGYWIATYRCTMNECRKFFFWAYVRVEDSLLTLYMHPQERIAEISEELEYLSSRFVELYRQAAETEHSGNFDLAACGYRNAVEALVKDYAIRYKSAVADKSLLRKSLQDCIMEYLDGLDEAISAYMVKEFGNTSTHYPQLDEPFDFEELKLYLGLFLQYMTGKIKILTVKENLPQKHLQKFEKPC